MDSYGLTRWVVRAGVWVVLAIVGPVSAMELEVSTGADVLQFDQVEGYDLIALRQKRASLEGEVGRPWLPERVLHVLIPADRKVTGVAGYVEEEAALPGTYTILPAQLTIPTCQSEAAPFVTPDAAVYASNTGLRPKAVRFEGTTWVRGYQIAMIRVFPLDYIPAQGQVLLRSRIRVELQLAAVDKNAKAERLAVPNPDPTFQALVQADVDNPEAMQALGYEDAQPLSPIDPNDVKYLVIGAGTMLDEFQPLLDWKTKKGVPAEAVDVNWVYANYAGADNQEKIKACIKDYVQTRGTVWVVLGGDNTIVPDRNCYGSVNGGSYTDTTMPTDLYYAGLDDMDWDDDGDGIAGEVGDDTIDMGADVIVGRFPVRTEAHVTAMVNKALQYEKSLLATGFAEKMLLTGEQLWTTGDAEAKSEFMYTDWIQPYWSGTRYRFYDTATDFTGGAAYDLSPANLSTQLANGYNFLHMATHGNSTIWSMETGGYYYASTAYNVSNPDRWGHILTIACITNAFDYSSDPCLSEGFVRNPNGGSVSYIGSSRYGWGYSGTTSHGSSFKYDRMFYQYLFTGEPTAHPQQLGAVYNHMKAYWVSSCNYYGSMRWCQFAINLMGDPELPIYTADPVTMNPSYLSVTAAGMQTFTVETGVPGAMVCLAKGSEVYVYGPADAGGTFQAAIAPTTVGDMTVTVTAPNYDPHEGVCNVAVGPEGNVVIAEDQVTCSAVLHVTLADSGLSGLGSYAVPMSAASGDSESLVVNESGQTPGFFAGTIQLADGAANPGDGVLQVTHSDVVTASYNDADDGTGTPAVQQDTATTDCQAPQILTTDLYSVTHRTAALHVTTDDAAMVRVRCGSVCGGPYPIELESAQADTDHWLTLDGLTETTPYALIVEAYDDLGNTSTDDNGGACYLFTTHAIPDYLTESFDPADDNDLDYLSLTFIPAGAPDFYTLCTDTIDFLPVDPAGGQTLSLSGNDYAAITPTGGQTVPFFQANYSTFYVGSNGYITFGSGDTNSYDTLAAHFDRPRISALFDDLDPAASGASVSWKQLADRIAVTWLDVPEVESAYTNTFQIELFFDGTIRISYLQIMLHDGLTGLSAGAVDMSVFGASDLSSYALCYHPADMDRDGDVDQDDFGWLQRCVTGSAIPQAEPACMRSCLDADTDVDVADRMIMLDCLSGVNVPADPGCMP